MTDIHGSAPDNHDDSLSEADAQDSITEVPSEYEFSDGLGPDDALEGKPARRSAFLPIAAALGGVLILGGIAWWQLGGNSSSLNGGSVPLPGTLSALAPAPQAPAAPKTASTPPVDIATSAPTAVVSSSALPNEPVAPALQVSPTEVSALIPAAPVALLSSSLPAPAPQAAPTPATQTPVIAPLPPPSISTAEPEAKADPRIDALNARIESLQKALDQSNQQLKAAGITGNEAALQDRIAKLEQQLATVPQRTESDGVSLTPTKESLNEMADPKASKAKAVAKKAAASAKPAVKKAPVEKAPAWVLRSAFPGTAWVSKTADSVELREVHVGDKLPGVGSVTAIEPQGDSWVVRGSSGLIR